MQIVEPMSFYIKQRNTFPVLRLSHAPTHPIYIIIYLSLSVYQNRVYPGPERENREKRERERERKREKEKTEEREEREERDERDENILVRLSARIGERRRGEGERNLKHGEGARRKLAE